MSVRFMEDFRDPGATRCRGCGARELYTDDHNDVWCAQCSTWNGWMVGYCFAQPGKMPVMTPEGEDPLF